MPCTILDPSKALRALLGQGREIALCLAFHPARRCSPQNEIVRGVQHVKPPTILRHVLQRDGRLRLVIELQAIGIVLILENSGEFVGVALELD